MLYLQWIVIIIIIITLNNKGIVIKYRNTTFDHNSLENKTLHNYYIKTLLLHQSVTQYLYNFCWTYSTLLTV